MNTFGEILRWNIFRFFGWITLLLVVVLIWNSKKGLIQFVYEKYILIISIIALISVVASLLFIFKVLSYLTIYFNLLFFNSLGSTCVDFVYVVTKLDYLLDPSRLTKGGINR